MTPAVLQREEARQKANKIRQRRAQLKLDIKAGRETAWAYLIAPPQYIEGMKVVELIGAAPRIGPVKRDQIMHKFRIPPGKKVGDLTERQRHELAERIRSV